MDFRVVDQSWEEVLVYVQESLDPLMCGTKPDFKPSDALTSLLGCFFGSLCFCLFDCFAILFLDVNAAVSGFLLNTLFNPNCTGLEAWLLRNRIPFV